MSVPLPTMTHERLNFSTLLSSSSSQLLGRWSGYLGFLVAFQAECDLSLRKLTDWWILAAELPDGLVTTCPWSACASAYGEFPTRKVHLLQDTHSATVEEVKKIEEVTHGWMSVSRQ
ncbi:psaE [Symbiodinium necroappetens]|uniref:PsaE protein n=1 Tax=Symbiodinium necroappetens TaxID=1628268 RepID=A0A812Q6P7_9DINO|nr:psaE [Symbiodinium necroappetens]